LGFLILCTQHLNNHNLDFFLTSSLNIQTHQQPKKTHPPLHPVERLLRRGIQGRGCSLGGSSEILLRGTDAAPRERKTFEGSLPFDPRRQLPVFLMAFVGHVVMKMFEGQATPLVSACMEF